MALLGCHGDGALTLWLMPALARRVEGGDVTEMLKREPLLKLTESNSGMWSQCSPVKLFNPELEETTLNSLLYSCIQTFVFLESF